MLWLFGDSFVGRVQDGRRIASHLINNSAALQTGTEPSDASLRFVYRSLPDGRPTAFSQPEDGVGWFWPYQGVRTPQGLFLFPLQIEPAEGPAGFGFKLAATWMGKIENPAADRYVLVYTEGGLSGHIALRFAHQPQGPWGPPIRVYRCPEIDWNPRIFCYAGKGHPELGDLPPKAAFHGWTLAAIHSRKGG